MRVIEFRAYDKENKKWLDVTKFNIRLENGKLQSNSNAGIIGGIEIMQFTGLLDKDGKKIFEGDIVSFVGFSVRVGVIVFRNAQFEIKLDKGYFKPNFNKIGVLGNIHDNPELLEKINICHECSN